MAANGATREAVQEILDCITTEAAMPIIDKYSMKMIYNILAARASARAERYVFGDLKVGTVIVTMAGVVLGLDDTAREIGGSMGWSIK
ncbi:hypothetical protein SDC9_113667 [bioreactor metagenome]|uniref:Uncharacterized protein n=1 Tax=bioreactor metagenome TaxID=1076179 RepID=A0A645BN20_9ZZZZ